MAASTAGALKLFIESLGLAAGLTAYRDGAPDGTKPPYVTIYEDLAMTPIGMPDGGSGSADYIASGSTAQGVREMAQVDLWQTWRGPDGKVAEQYPLARNLLRRLHGCRLLAAGSGAPPQTVYAVKVVNMIRSREQDTNLVHHALTLEIEANVG